MKIHTLPSKLSSLGEKQEKVGWKPSKFGSKKSAPSPQNSLSKRPYQASIFSGFYCQRLRGCKIPCKSKRAVFFFKGIVIQPLLRLLLMGPYYEVGDHPLMYRSSLDLTFGVNWRLQNQHLKSFFYIHFAMSALRILSGTIFFKDRTLSLLALGSDSYTFTAPRFI